jgi:hypothetical protein
MALGFFMMAVLFLLAGCKDLWHPQDDNGKSGEAVGKPSAPGTPTVTAGNASLTVTWLSVSNRKSYSVYYSTSTTVPSTAAKSGITSTSTTLTGLTNGQTYYVWVQAVNSAGSSALSGWASGTPKAGSSSNTKTIKLNKNVYDTGSNNQAEVDDMFTKAIEKGAIYKLTIAGKSDHDIPRLQAVLINNSTTWTELSNYNDADGWITANQNFSFTIELSASENGGDIDVARSNMVVIQGVGADDGDIPAFNGAITLTLTELKIEKIADAVIKTYTAATASAFASAVSTINNADRGDHTITVTGSFTADPVSFLASSYEKTITIKGNTNNRTISLGSNGSLITVNSGVTLTLGNNVTLNGRSGNTASLVSVQSGGTLIMNNGSIITGNSTNTSGGGVNSYGNVTINGGEISNNSTSSQGGGISTGGNFVMNYGLIRNNTANVYGGGVDNSGNFTMNGGTISGNTQTSTSGGGGGVMTAGGSFTMTGGSISGNIDQWWASGVLVWSGNNVDILGTFLKTGGTIYGSNAAEDLKNKGGDAVVVEGAAYTNNGMPASNPLPTRKRITTADPGVTLDSTKLGSAGGWENSDINSDIN